MYYFDIHKKYIIFLLCIMYSCCFMKTTCVYARNLELLSKQDMPANNDAFSVDVVSSENKNGSTKKQINVRVPIAVKSGQVVKLQFIKNRLSIETAGICLSSGAIGNIIKVKNQDSGKVVNGMVMDENTVSVLH